MEPGSQIPHKFKEWFRNDWDHWQTWRDDAEICYDFYAGRQWSSAEEASLKKKFRPIITFNRMGIIVDSIHGHEIGNRREVRFIPREQGDAAVNGFLTGAAQWFRDEADSDDEESDAFLDMLISGMGWTETTISYEESDEGKPSEDRIDPLEMAADFNAKKRNVKDAKRIWRARSMPISEARILFPDRSDDELDALWSIGHDSVATSNSDGTHENGDYNVMIVQCQWIEHIQKIVTMDPMTNQKIELTPEEFDTLSERMVKMGGTQPPRYPVRRKVRMQAFFGETVLSWGEAPCPHEFSLQAITGKRDRNKGVFFGIVKPMLDPQRWANKWLSQVMHIMNTNSKGGLMAEEGAFKNKAEAERTWADPSAITMLRNGAISMGKVKEKPSADFPVGFRDLTEFAISSIRDVSGVSVEMLGMREADQAARLEAQRKQAGMTILQPFFDSLKQHRMMQGRVILHYIQEDLSDGRLVKIGGQTSAKYVPLVKQASAEYDIIVDDAPTSPNQKEYAWAMLTELLPLLGREPDPQTLAALLAYSPLPVQVVEELQGLAQKRAESQQPLQQMQQKMQLEQHQTEIAKRLSETEENKAQAEKIRAETVGETANTEYTAVKATLDAANFLRPSPQPSQGQ